MSPRQQSHLTTLALACGLLFGAHAAHGQQDDVAEPSRAVAGVDYRVYDRYGNESSLLGIVSAAFESDVLLVGEEHDDMIGHAIEVELLERSIEELGGRAGSSGRTIVLSLEMFERDVQYVLDEYLDGVISEDHFLRSSRPWDDYDERYRSLIEAAKSYGGPVVAANAPRRYVNLVTREGPRSLEGLSGLAKRYLPPLPYPGPSDRYRAEWDALMAEAMAEMRAAADSAASESIEEGDQHQPASDSEEEAAAADEARPGPEGADQGPDHSESSNAIYSQALWDAAMGHAITTALVEHLGSFVVHFAGSFHVARGTGIAERIEDYRPGTRVTSVVMTKVDDISKWSVDEHAELAEFVVLTKQPAEEPTTDGR